LERLNISSAWKISEEFAVVLEEFESAVSGAVEVFRVTVFILRRDVNADSDRFQRVVRRRENFETSLETRGTASGLG